MKSSSSKHRVTIIGLNYAPEPTGIAPYTTRLAELLASQGHAVQIVTGYPHYPAWKLAKGYSGWQCHETRNGVAVTRLRHFIPSNHSNFNRMHMELSFGLRLLFARWNTPDVVLLVSPSLFASAFGLFRARLGISRPATGVWVQDIYTRGLAETGSGNSIQTRLMKLFEGLVFRSAVKVTVIHDRFRDYLVSELGVRSENVGVIRNWTHLKPVEALDRSATRQTLGWGDETVVLHAGNIGVKQALENVVLAAQKADDVSAKVKFVLLGSGNQREKIQELAMGVERIEFLAPVSDEEFNAVLHAADILLVNEMPGLREMAVPSKLTSYFSTGLPVLAATEFNSTTATEIASSGAGLRISPGRPAELLEAVINLAADSELAEKLGQAGKNYAKNVLSEEAAIIQYSAWLRELATAK
ncbi:glycosyltransferase family 4 protein [Arthrobacter sp. A2-55]|uniref:glycosyltransferase family 4 protein n=1 Tax=Arthrobacter sp. A2-55 TaxID=2897337 RepID=UPI0021CD9E3C|nr:glycosyltransferase family 4 protein [Arthrobacter sp. A2-55]MCU6479904.1 glycosyltransferase family 4 protein [Arthrobacter sp. A2-55]